MKLNRLFVFAIVLGSIVTNSFAQKSNTLDSIKVIKEFENLYKSGDYYLGGQPTLESIKWLKTEGVTLFINLRTESENEKFTKTAFNEENLIAEYGINYISIPVSFPDSYTPEILQKFAQTLDSNQDKVFIHCASGGRVSNFFMAYLIKYKGYTINEAIDLGKQMNYSFPIENLLGQKIHMTFKE